MSVLLVDQEWQIWAACRGRQAIVFFPPSYFERKAERREREQRAKSICTSCRVQDDCLAYALQIREQHGIWGGLSEKERKALFPDREAVTV